MDIVEVIRLVRSGASDHTIREVLGHNRRTIAKYRAWASAQGLLEEPMPEAGTVQRLLTRTLPPALPPQQVSRPTPYRAEIAALWSHGVEMTAIRARLEEQHGHPVSYSAVRRVVPGLVPS